jgi:hypothetical protein
VILLKNAHELFEEQNIWTKLIYDKIEKETDSKKRTRALGNLIGGCSSLSMDAKYGELKKLVVPSSQIKPREKRLPEKFHAQMHFTSGKSQILLGMFKSSSGKYSAVIYVLEDPLKVLTPLNTCLALGKGFRGSPATGRFLLANESQGLRRDAGAVRPEAGDRSDPDRRRT